MITATKHNSSPVLELRMQEHALEANSISFGHLAICHTLLHCIYLKQSLAICHSLLYLNFTTTTRLDSERLYRCGIKSMASANSVMSFADICMCPRHLGIKIDMFNAWRLRVTIVCH